MLMRILIADDHGIVRKGLVGMLQGEFPSAEIVEAEEAETLFKLALKGQWDLIISDLSMPGRSGLEVIQEIKQHVPGVPVLILSVYPERLYGTRVLKAGASGYLSKDSPPEELARAIHYILQGRKYITPVVAEKLVEDIGGHAHKLPHEVLSDREMNVLKLLAAGESLIRIGELLSIAPSTVSSYRARILKKMGLDSNADLTRYWVENGLG
jgi:two-component system, NarL family, invasion response regulator UvrY